MNYEPEDILAEFGYTLERSPFILPPSIQKLDRLEDLRSRIQESLPYISLTSETARRELLIAPLLLEVVHYTHAQLRLEYPLNVTDQLKGSLDYYLYSVNKYHDKSVDKLIVIEAKNADLAKGFTQLAVELIALDKWIDTEQPILQGAVSTGAIWQFGVLDREQKKIQQGLTLYRVPEDLEDVLRILVKLLES